jgi:hypothetical protein
MSPIAKTGSTPSADSQQRSRVLHLLMSSAFLCLGWVPLKAGDINFAEPTYLVGNIFAPGAGQSKYLFKSERRSTQTGMAIHVTCDYTYPDGSFAARDRIVYEGQRLVSFEEDELQTSEKGSAVVRPDPKNPGKWRVYFEYTTGQGSAATKSSASESLQNDTLVDDMIPAFMVSHWDALEKGQAARFRYIALSRKETIGFELVKDGETNRGGKPMVRIKMEPTSIIIARLVDPLFFIVEKNGAHRVIEYIGRTTPLIKSGNKWKDLDAVTVFDWKHDIAGTGGQPVPSEVH